MNIQQTIFGIIGAFFLQLAPTAAATLTANPSANDDAQALLRYLQSLSTSSDHRFISGQFIGAIDEYVQEEGQRMSYGFSHYVEKLRNNTGKYVGLIGVNFTRWTDCKTPAPGAAAPKSPFMTCDGSPPNYDHTVDLLTRYYRMGGLISVMWHAPNPWTGGPSPDKTVGTRFSDLYSPSTSIFVVWHKMLDDLAAGLKILQQRKVVVLFRPLFEQNGDWFWWGDHGSGAHPTREEFQALWKDMFQYLTEQHHLNNLLWVFSPNRSGVPGAMLNRAPPPQLYDIVGVDYYVDEREKSLACSDLQATKKPLALAEYGPSDDYAQAPKTKNNFEYNRIFKVADSCPGFAFFMAWNGNARHPQSMAENRNADLVLNNPRTLNLGDIEWKK